MRHEATQAHAIIPATRDSNMKRSICLIVLLTAAAVCSAQTNKTAVDPDLSKFSSAQLKACLDDAKLCGSSDIWPIMDELARRLPSLPTEQLVSCFVDWKICGAEEDQASGWPISDELARRGDPHDLLVRYWTEPNSSIRDGIEHVAYHFDTPEVTAFMRRVLIVRKDDGEDFYWPANYLAKKCDPLGLKELSTGEDRNQGCLQYETTVQLFGKCRYRPAIPYLVDSAINDICGNIIDAAANDLAAMYPGSPKEFRSLEKMQKYYCGRAKLEGLKVDCVAK
jgi:hypothetical protein